MEDLNTNANESFKNQLISFLRRELGKRKKIKNPFQIGEICEKLIKQGYYSSAKELARDVGIDDWMLSQFIATLKIPEEYRGELVKIGVGIDVAYWLTRFSSEELKYLIYAIRVYNFSSSDIRKIADYHRRAKKPVEECVREIVKWSRKPREAVITDLTDEALKYLMDEARKSQKTIEELIKQILSRELGIYPIAVKLSKNICTIVLSRRNYKLFLESSEKMKIPPEELLSTVVISVCKHY
jgi:DNA-directed RNA polymerase subunit F